MKVTCEDGECIEARYFRKCLFLFFFSEFMGILDRNFSGQNCIGTIWSSVDLHYV